MEEPSGIVYFINIFSKKRKKNLLTVNDYKTKIIWYIKDTFLISSYAQIIIMPIIAYTYKTISLTFFITNILTSFLIGIIIIVGFFLILVSFMNIQIAKLLGNLYKLFIDLLLIIAKYTSDIPFSKIYVKTPQIWQIMLYYIIIFLGTYLYKKFGKEWIKLKIKEVFNIIIKNNKKFVAVLIIIVIFILISIKVPNNLKVYFIDVGQGDSCLIITPNNTKILIDRRGK